MQVLASGEPLPRIVEAREIRVPAGEHETIGLRVPLDAADSRWAILRVSDPDRPADRRARGAYAELGDAVAYSSPFYFEPD
jgi:hypothetical protein